MSSTDHQRPVETSTVTTVGLPRAYASARAVRRVARKSPVAEAKLPRDLRRLSAIADMPASTPAMATVISISMSVKPLARRRREPRAVISPPPRHQSPAGQESKRHAIANQLESWLLSPKARPIAVATLCTSDTIFL